MWWPVQIYGNSCISMNQKAFSDNSIGHTFCVNIPVFILNGDVQVFIEGGNGNEFSKNFVLFHVTGARLSKQFCKQTSYSHHCTLNFYTYTVNCEVLAKSLIPLHVNFVMSIIICQIIVYFSCDRIIFIIFTATSNFSANPIWRTIALQFTCVSWNYPLIR